MNSKYTGREIAIFTDVHGLLEPTIAILDDIKKRGIKEIYSLGDNIGFGPNPSEVLDLLGENNVISINGNSEEYSIMGIEPFPYFSGDTNKIKNQEWTYSELTSDQIKNLSNNKHSIDLIVGGMKIGLCHFANDVRIDFGSNSTWGYQDSINNGIENPNKQFEYTNSKKQQEQIDYFSSRGLEKDQGYISAKNDRLFDGKLAEYYDEIIQGHVHFKFLTENEKMKIRTIRAAAMAFGENEPVDFASYIIIKEKEKGYDVEEILVPFDRNMMIFRIKNSTMPDKDTVTKYTSKR